MGILDLFRRKPSAKVSLAVAAPGAGDEVPELGYLSKRWADQFGAGLFSSAEAEISRMYGPCNPLVVNDFDLSVMRNDWSIGLALAVWKATFQGVQYWFEGGSQEINAFCSTVILNRFPQWLDCFLNSLDFGRQCSELDWRVTDLAYSWFEKKGDGPEAKPEKIERVARGAYVWGPLRDLDPLATDLKVDGDGEFIGASTSGVRTRDMIPRDRLVHVVNEGEFGSLYGRALTARSYLPWRWKMIGYVLFNRYLEQKGNPPLFGFAPDEMRVDPKTGEEEDPIQVILTGLLNLRGGGAFVFPSEWDETSKQPRFGVQALQLAQRAQEFLPYLQHLEAIAFIATLFPPILAAAPTSSGAAPFGDAKIALKLFHKLLDQRKNRLVIEPVNEQALPRLVRANFSKVRDSDIPKFRASSLSENAEEVLAEILRGALALNAAGRDGGLKQIASMIDWPQAFAVLGVPVADPDLVPDQPSPAEVAAREEKMAAQKAAGGARGAAGRPARIAPESKRDAAPSRPGLGRFIEGEVIEVRLAASAVTAEDYFARVADGLAAIDAEVSKVERISDDYRIAAEASMRAALRRGLLSAKLEDDGRIAGTNRRLPDAIGALVEEQLEDVLEHQLLDAAELAGADLALALRSPLVEGHVSAGREAAKILRDVGLPAPGPTAHRRIIGDQVTDSRRNGRGVIANSTRRVVESVGRVISGGITPSEAETVASSFQIRRQQWIQSTVHHVRASARATLAWNGVEAEVDAWLALAGPNEEARVLIGAPKGEAAAMLYRPFTTRELDALYADRNSRVGYVSHWRGLGLTFGSPEYYVPVPRGDVGAAILALAASKREDWDRRRNASQDVIDAQNAAADSEAGSEPD